MASDGDGRLHLESLGLERMASGHLCLNLSERVTWESFDSYAEEILRTVGGVKTSASESVEMKLWKVSINGQGLSLAFSDYPPMVSLESSDAGGDDVLQDLHAKLKQR